MVNPLHGKTWVLIGFKWVDVSASPIFFCLETPGQDQVNTWKTLDQLEIEWFFAICSLQNRLQAFRSKG